VVCDAGRMNVRKFTILDRGEGEYVYEIASSELKFILDRGILVGSETLF